MLHWSHRVGADPGVLDETGLRPIGNVSLVDTDFEIPIMSKALPLIDPNNKSPAATLLRRLENRGVAAGFSGVLYDNRDGGHSLLPSSMFPRLAHLQYSADLKEKKADIGLGGRIILPAIVVGNSSTAITSGGAPRSQTRYAMTTPQSSAQSFLTYISNHLYVYPEHLDYDAIDLFPVNWPYTLTSQGSSHSDKPIYQALLYALAAFRPETQERLGKERLIAPTLQMIFRRSLKGVYTREQYMSGLANPVVFDGKKVAPERMVSLASYLLEDEIPPLVVLNVVEESFRTQAGLAGLSELLFDTPASIARIWRGFDYTKSMTISAEATKDPNGRSLKFTWVLLQGLQDHVRITPHGPGNSRAKIEIDWHNTFNIGNASNPDRVSNRVDIGVFANNGKHDSAPSFISVAFPGHQVRKYETRGANGKRVSSVDYDAEARSAIYDPVLFWSAPWKDQFVYGLDGELASVWRISETSTTRLRNFWERDNGLPVQYSLGEIKRKRLLKMHLPEQD